MTMQTSVIDMYDEASRYFMGEGTLNKTLERLSRDLDERGIDYMVIGAVALFAHGYQRFTKGIDLVMTAEGLEEFHDELKRLRSTSYGVIKFVTLEKLIELKLASGISAADRLKDLADVQELIKIRKLDADFGSKLDPYVRTKYLELEEAVRKSESSQEK